MRCQTQGAAVINGDDDFAEDWARRAGARRVLRFGASPHCDINGNWRPTDQGLALSLNSPAGSLEVALNCRGDHNAVNALAACAAAIALGLNLEDVAHGLAAFRPVDGRLNTQQMVGGWLLLEDTYNANPASVRAGIAVLAGLPGERWLVLGDMRELGADADALHFQIGAEARRAGVQRLFALGRRTAHAVSGFGTGGEFFPDLDALTAALRSNLHPEVVCLIKGSRGMRMERVSAALEGC